MQVIAAGDIGDVVPGFDLAAAIADVCALAQWNDGAQGLRDGDIVVVTSKVVSKAEGRIVSFSSPEERAAIIEKESVRIVARRGPTTIVETHHGLILAAAGVDESNTDPGTLVLLPTDPDASARALRASLSRRVGVVITDTMGRAWRLGITEHAIGMAGVTPLLDVRGQSDHTGRPLSRTIIGVGDQIAAAAGLVVEKAARRPVTIIRGLDHFVIDHDGPGARALIRPSDEDMFREGYRDR